MTVGLRPTSLPVAKTYDFANPESDFADIVWYATSVANLSSTAPNGQSLLQIDRGVDFYWLATSLHADVTSTGTNAQTESTVVVPLVNVSLFDAASGKRFENLSFPVASLAGAGERPYYLVAPRIVPGATALRAEWKSIVTPGVTYNTVYLVLHGFTRPSQWPS